MSGVSILCDRILSPLTVSLRQVWGCVEVCPAHVVPVSLGADASLLDPRVTATAGQHTDGRPVGRHDRRVLIHHAAEGPPGGAGVLRRRPGKEGGGDKG